MTLQSNSTPASGCLILFLIVSFFSVCSIRAQQPDSSFTITGTVYSQTQEPLPGATVFFPELEKGTAAGIDGTFELKNIPGGSYKIRITYVGYHTVDTLVTITSDISLNFSLKMNDNILNELIVTAAYDTLTASVRSVTTLTKDELDKKRGQTLGDMIKHLPGVSTLTTGPAVSKPVIRGLHSQRIVLNNHGVTQEGQQWGGDHAPEIDPFLPDRIEVIRGAASVEYGTGAIGGVIRVDSDPINKKENFSGMVSMNGYTNNDQGAGSIRAEGGVGSQNKLGWRIRGSYRNASDSQSPRDVIRNSGFRERDFAVTLNYDQGALTHDVHFSHFGTDLGIFRGAHIGNVTDLERAIRLGRPTVDFESSRNIDNPKQEISHDLFRYKGIYDTEKKKKKKTEVLNGR